MLFCSLFVNKYFFDDLIWALALARAKGLYRILVLWIFVFNVCGYLFLMRKGWRNGGQFRALRVKELRIVPGFEWTEESYSTSSQQGNSSKCKPGIQTKFSESVAIFQQVLGNWFLFISETPYRDNNSYVCHGIGFDVIWKAVKDSQIGRHYRRLFITIQYFPTSTGNLRSRLLSSDRLPNKDQSQLLHRGFCPTWHCS